jgi:hypothetical protein
MDDGELLEHVQAFRVTRTGASDEFEWLLVAPTMAMKVDVLVFLAVESGWRALPSIDVSASDLGTPSYMPRCRRVAIAEFLLTAIRTAPASTGTNAGREAAWWTAAREAFFAKRRGAEIDACRPLSMVVVSEKREVVTRLETLVARRGQVVGATRPDDVVVSSRIDGVLVDAALPDWGAIRAIDWLQAQVPPACMAMLVTEPRHATIFAMVRGRGVQLVTDLDQLTALVAVAERRNLERVRALERQSAK